MAFRALGVTCEVIWGECVAETEDEVISLSVSFLIAQVFLGSSIEACFGL